MRRTIALPCAVPLLLAGCAEPARQPPPPTAVSTGELTTLTVESVDQTQRSVLVRGPAGRLATVRVGPQVRNLAQLRAGDRVIVEHAEAVAVQMARPGAAPAEAVGVAARAPAGARPGAAVAEAERVRVRIDAVDASTGTVSFHGPDGIRRRVRPRTPEMQAFARGLRPGDEVDVAVAEAVAVRVEPMR